MQPEIIAAIIAAASIIVTFILSTWRWSVSQNKRFDQVIQELHSQNSKLRDEFSQQISGLHDGNSKLRDEFREDNSKLRDEFRDEFKELRKAINQLDRRLAHQQALTQALWSRTFKEDATTSVPVLPE